jgi:hypothetical protein
MYIVDIDMEIHMMGSTLDIQGSIQLNMLHGTFGHTARTQAYLARHSIPTTTYHLLLLFFSLCSSSLPYHVLAHQSVTNTMYSAL